MGLGLGCTPFPMTATWAPFWRLMGQCLERFAASCSMLGSALGEGKRDIFCSPRIALERRVLLFKTHVLTSLLAGAGAWPWLCAAGWNMLEAGLHNMTRQMLRIPRSAEQNWSRERIAVKLGILPLPGLLAIERIRFLGQLLRSGPDAAFALVQHAPSAQRAFHAAGEWFCEAVQGTGGPGPMDSCWEQWSALLMQPGRLKGLLKRAEAWHLASCAAWLPSSVLLGVVLSRSRGPLLRSMRPSMLVYLAAWGFSISTPGLPTRRVCTSMFRARVASLLERVAKRAALFCTLCRATGGICRLQFVVVRPSSFESLVCSPCSKGALGTRRVWLMVALESSICHPWAILSLLSSLIGSEARGLRLMKPFSVGNFLY